MTLQHPQPAVRTEECQQNMISSLAWRGLSALNNKHQPDLLRQNYLDRRTVLVVGLTIWVWELLAISFSSQKLTLTWHDMTWTFAGPSLQRISIDFSFLSDCWDIFIRSRILFTITYNTENGERHQRQTRMVCCSEWCLVFSGVYVVCCMYCVVRGLWLPWYFILRPDNEARQPRNPTKTVSLSLLGVGGRAGGEINTNSFRWSDKNTDPCWWWDFLPNWRAFYTYIFGG